MKSYYIDSEFIEDGVTIDLLSMALVCEDGRELYVCNADARLNLASDWVVKNVFPHLPIRWEPITDDPRTGFRWDRLLAAEKGIPILRQTEIATEIRRFIDAGVDDPQFVGYFSDYDWVVFCQLFGRMVDLPANYPKFCIDVNQWIVEEGMDRKLLPSQDGTEHHALYDARWINKVAEYREYRRSIDSARL